MKLVIYPLENVDFELTNIQNLDSTKVANLTWNVPAIADFDTVNWTDYRILHQAHNCVYDETPASPFNKRLYFPWDWKHIGSWHVPGHSPYPLFRVQTARGKIFVHVSEYWWDLQVHGQSSRLPIQAIHVQQKLALLVLVYWQIVN